MFFLKKKKPNDYCLYLDWIKKHVNIYRKGPENMLLCNDNSPIINIGWKYISIEVLNNMKINQNLNIKDAFHNFITSVYINAHLDSKNKCFEKSKNYRFIMTFTDRLVVFIEKKIKEGKVSINLDKQNSNFDLLNEEDFIQEFEKEFGTVGERNIPYFFIPQFTKLDMTNRIINRKRI